MKKTFLLTIITIVMASCGYKIARPPRSSNPATYPKLDSSTIQASVYLAAHTVRREIMNQIQNPVVQGNSGRISIKLLATEQITTEEMVRQLIKPYEPGYWKDVLVEVSETVRESFSCALTPWRWGTCWKDVIKKTWKATKVWVEPQLAVYAYVSQPVTQFIDRIYPTSAQVNFKGDITNIDLGFDNNTVKTTTYVKVNISVDYEQATVPLGPSIKLKGVLNCDIEAKIDVNGKLSISNDKQLVFNLNENDTRLQFTKICIPGAVEALDIQAILNPKLLLLKTVLSQQVHKIINEKLSDAIKKGSDGLDFKKQYDELTNTIQKPLSISENVWLVSNVSETYVSPFTSVGSGVSNKLLFNIGLTARPDLYYSLDTPKVAPPKPVPFSVKPISDSRVNIAIAAHLNYSTATPLIDSALNKAISQIHVSTPIIQNYLTRKNLGVSNVQLYPSDKKLVVGIDIVKKKNNKKALTIYLSALPKYDSVRNYFYIEEVAFTLDTRNVLLKILKSVTEIDIVEKAINKEIAKNARLDVDTYYRNIIDTIKHFDVPLQMMHLTGNFNPIKVSEVFTTDSALMVYVSVGGKLEATVDPNITVPDKSNLISDTLNVQSVIADKRVTITPQFYTGFIPPLQPNANDFSAVINKNISGNKLTSNVEKAKISAATSSPAQATAKKTLPKLAAVALKLPHVNVGDTIYYEDKGKILIRIAGLKDKTLVGDTVLIKKEGSIERYRIEKDQ